MPRISRSRARRIALAAQGFADPRPSGRVDVRHFRRVLRRVNVVQLDSVNVFARAHYLPFLSRLGPYASEALDRWLWDSGEVFEYWGHEASLLPIDQRPLFAHRMTGGWHWGSVERIGDEHPEVVAGVLDEITTRGALTVADLSSGEDRSESWWGWRSEKIALEHLFLHGRLTVAARPNFHRVYDLPERVVSREILDRPAVPEDDARRELLLLAAASHGIGTVHDLADYHRIPVSAARPLLDELAASGALEWVEVEGEREPYLLHPAALASRRIGARALLAPFDPVVWHRPRAARLFGFRYRLEIYVPARRRVHGYYVLPFLLGDRLVARVDLKADRASGALLVRAAHAEDGVDRSHVSRELALALEEAAAWQGLGEIRVEPRGDLADDLAGHT